jgi:uncharacterized protein with HEPN domain
MRDDRERLLDILDAIEKIEKYAAKGREAYDSDELLQSWMVHNIFIIGEAAARISENLQEAHSDIPWTKIIAMRNILVHAYFRVDPDEIWEVVEHDLPILKTAVQSLLDSQP